MQNNLNTSHPKSIQTTIIYSGNTSQTSAYYLHSRRLNFGKIKNNGTQTEVLPGAGGANAPEDGLTAELALPDAGGANTPEAKEIKSLEEAVKLRQQILAERQQNKDYQAQLREIQQE